ncbi:MAG TPA: BTAD domain-containing putative transcriptional regulator [Gammaproteobacteria bacterium]|nr:BTAD domain-containing putative transcriptional regulator [Gammaproteobacteria bacterium]
MPATAKVARRLAAKITQPRLARPLTRQRLHEVLDGMLTQHAVVWVAAPPGFGKTSLVSNYLESRSRQVMWYQVDERDDDIASFFHYLTLAAQFDLPEAADLPRYSPEYTLGLTAFARSFFGALFTTLPERVALVFDNYQEVQEDAVLHQVMQVAADELPVDCRLIIISRHLPSPAYTRLWANQRLAVLDQAQLAFKEDEALALLALRGHDISGASPLRSWLAINKGWAAGLVLYSEWARLGYAGLKCLESLGTEAVFDYFAGQIQAKISEQDVRFLTESALLPVMKPALAAELTGFAAAGEVLARLHRRNTFTTRYDGAAVAYEFHPLFRKYLLDKLERSLDLEALTALQWHAAALLAHDGQIEAAMDLLVKAQRWPEMAALLREHAAELINHGRHRLMGQWLAQIPDELFDAEPWLAYWYGACQIFDSAAKSQTWMERAYQGFKKTGEVEGICLAWCGVCRAIRFGWSDYSRYDPWIAELETLLHAYAPLPSTAQECEVLLTALAALHWRNPIYPRIGEWTARALALADASADLRLQVDALARVAHFELTHDDVSKATRRIEHLERLLASRVNDPFVDIFAQYVMGLHTYAVGDCARAATIFQKQIKHAHALGLFTYDVVLHTFYGFARLAQGDIQDALQARDELKSSPGIQGAYGAHFYHQLCAAVALEQGATERAARHAQEMIAAAERAGSPFIRAWALTTLAGVKVMTGDDYASDDLDAALDASRRLGSRWPETGVLICRALYACQIDSPENARCALQEAMAQMRAQTLLRMAYASELVRLFAARALEYGIDPDYACKILAASPGATGHAPPAHLEGWPWALKIYTLGSFRLVKHGIPVTFGRKPPRRPLEVLQALIAMGGREVAETYILDALWPNEEADAARNAFSTALHRLRKIVGRELVQLGGGKLRLDTSRCWVDIWAFEALLERAKYSTAADHGALQQALELYKGKFLAEHAEAPWSIPMRDRLQGRYAEVVTRLAEACQRAGDHEGAVALFQRGLRMDELREDYYQGLMRSYIALERPEEARQAFAFCKRRLAIQLNRKPSPATEALLEVIRRHA